MDIGSPLNVNSQPSISTILKQIEDFRDAWLATSRPIGIMVVRPGGNMGWKGLGVMLFAGLLPTWAEAQSTNYAAWEKQRKLDEAAQVQALVQSLKAAQPQVRGAAPQTRPLGTVTSPSNKQTFQVSVVTEAEALALVQTLRKDPAIPFEYLQDGAYARAHTMVRNLEKAGIIAGKAWIEGKPPLCAFSEEFGEIKLDYHVAPMILVGSQLANTIQVLDPSLSLKPLSLTAWKALLTRRTQAKVTETYFTPRFHYGPYEKAEAKTGYDEESIEDAIDSNDKFWQMLAFIREQMKRDQKAN